MNIAGYLVKTDEIVGIGPLLRRKTENQAMLSLYNSTMLFFTVYLKQSAITIESPWFDIGYRRDDKGENYIKARRDCDQFFDTYVAIKQQIAALIGEPPVQECDATEAPLDNQQHGQQ